MTDHAREVGEQMFGRLAAHVGPVLAGRSADELAAIADFLEAVSEATRAARAEVEGRA